MIYKLNFKLEKILENSFCLSDWKDHLRKINLLYIATLTCSKAFFSLSRCLIPPICLTLSLPLSFSGHCILGMRSIVYLEQK